MSVRVPADARDHWNVWLEVALALAITYGVSWLPTLGVEGAALRLTVVCAMHGAFLWFGAVEGWAVATKRSWWTLSWRMWEYPFGVRLLLAAWLGAMGAVMVASSPLWGLLSRWIGFDFVHRTLAGSDVTTVPMVVGSIVWVGLAGWLIVHNGEQGELG